MDGFMSDPHGRTNADHAIALMDEGVRANLRDPYITGFLVELPGEGEIMITGDLHGHRSNLRRIVELANLPRYRRRHLVLQELVHDLTGEDGVCHSCRLVETAARLKVAFPSQVHILLGNHEFSELLNLEIGKKGRELNAAFDEGGRYAYRDGWDDVKASYKRFWQTTPLAVRTQNRLFITHSTSRASKMGDLSLDYFRNTSPDDVFNRRGPIFDMLWGRDYREETANEFARRMKADILIVGHTACEDGIRAPNNRHIILDCKDHEGRYLILPLDQPLTHEDVLACACRLYGSA